MDIELAKRLCKEKKLRWTNHIFLRLTQRNILMAEVREAILSGQIIEEYPDDYPYPSCLLIGCCINSKILHIVCSVNGDNSELWLITAYVPDSVKWEPDFKTRRNGK